MKNRILIFSLFLSICAYSQDTAIRFEGIIKVDGFSKKTLYKNSLQANNIIFNNDSCRMQFKNEFDGKIVLKCNFKYATNDSNESKILNGIIDYDLTVISMKGSYQYILTNFIHDASDPNGRNMGLIKSQNRIIDGVLIGLWSRRQSEMRLAVENAAIEILATLDSLMKISH